MICLTKDKLSVNRAKNVVATCGASAVEWDVIAYLPRFPKIKPPQSGVDFFVRDESNKTPRRRAQPRGARDL